MHVRGEHVDTAGSGSFGLIHRDVGLFEEPIG
jgi:hypothetical protein